MLTPDQNGNTFETVEGTIDGETQEFEMTKLDVSDMERKDAVELFKWISDNTDVELTMIFAISQEDISLEIRDLYLHHMGVERICPAHIFLTI